MNFEELTTTVSSSIINNVILKIENYIRLVEPEDLVYIAFDGVAPVAKLQQQRERRYKSWYQGKITKSIFKKITVDPFNTVAITPGTQFMEELNNRMTTHFVKKETASFLNVDKIIVSGSNECGEGEHKLFHYMRTNSVCENQVNLVYGLDADLIMLSLNNLPVCPQTYLFRETPEFIKSLDSSLEPDSTYYLDIPELSGVITDEMTIQKTIGPINVNRIHDYIFLCFFLGNDFLPHFPSINIRTGGVDKMLHAYKATVGQTNEILCDGRTIYWKNVRLLVEFLFSQEEKYIREEFVLRTKRERRFPDKTPEQIFTKFENIPSHDRTLEKYIDPWKPGWQGRYYSSLFNITTLTEEKKRVCTNYLEGLEWTMKYYTTGCVDWRWHYQFSYPPLLEDLIHMVPYFERTLVPLCQPKPVSPLVQLSYVLPQTSLSLLPEPIFQHLLKEHKDWYPTECEFLWVFCKYFWESHVLLPDINIDQLEKEIESI